jgi:hypothetical protein
MRLLPTLVVIQLALLAFLAVKVTLLERLVGSPEPGTMPPGESRVTARERVDRTAATPSLAELEASLRRVVREEIAAVVQAGASLTARDATNVETGSVARRPDPQHLAAVSSQLDYFIGVGSISPSEMAALQEDIARLDASARKQMLGRLVRAMNTGNLKGEL